MELLKPCISFVLEMPITLWFFHRFSFSGQVSLFRRFLGCSLLLCLLPLYLIRAEIPFGFFLRFPYRGLVYFLALSIAQDMKWDMRLHLSLCELFLMVNAQMFFGFARVMGIESLFASFFPSAEASALALASAETLFMLIIHVLFLSIVPVERFRGISQMQFTAYMMCILSGIFIRTSMVDFYESGNHPESELELFGALLTVSLFACIAIIECYYYLGMDAMQLRQTIKASEYEVAALRLKEQNEKNVRKIYHDMKNHFIALDGMLRENRMEEMHTYLSTLQEQLQWERPIIETGNPILNQLLSEKMGQAAAKQIPLTVELDYSSCAFVKSVDTVVLFGNALDNAIEAASQVEPARRFLRIKGSSSAGRFFCVISNPYQSPLHFINGLPVTSKEDVLLHGYGLSNIRRVLNQYSGEMRVSETEGNVFSLYMSFPIND